MINDYGFLPLFIINWFFFGDTIYVSRIVSVIPNEKVFFVIFAAEIEMQIG